MVVYPDADHGFFCDQRATYQKAAAEDAWKRVKALFKSELLRSHSTAPRSGIHGALQSGEGVRSGARECAGAGGGRWFRSDVAATRLREVRCETGASPSL